MKREEFNVKNLVTQAGKHLYNLKKELVDVEEAHQSGNFLKSMVKFNLYSTKDGNFSGQIAWIPWQDGATLSYSGKFGPPQLFFNSIGISFFGRI